VYEISVAFGASSFTVIRRKGVPERRICKAICLPAGVRGSRVESLTMRTAKSIKRSSRLSANECEVMKGHFRVQCKPTIRLPAMIPPATRILNVKCQTSNVKLQIPNEKCQTSNDIWKMSPFTQKSPPAQRKDPPALSPSLTGLSIRSLTYVMTGATGLV